ncbi:MAG TPA: DUF3667 domain-containing protein, partial [Chitinophagaceae bacterium]
QGRYCHVCGQENVVPKETFWHMFTHFFYDITHFDSSFFTTLKDLLFKPGFLSKEYMLGRRKKYLHPIRMYVFTSALFFLLFFSVFAPKNSVRMNTPEQLTGTERLDELADIEKKFNRDSVKYIKDGTWQQKIKKLEELRDTTKAISTKDFEELGARLFILNISGQLSRFDRFNEYDSAQQLLPSSKRDNWFTRRLVKKEFSLSDKYRYDPKSAFEKLTNSILHNLPYMLFVSLPLFALLLKLLYRRRRDFYFADHGVFTIHLYIFSFILLLLVFAIGKLQVSTGWDILNWVLFLLFVLLLFYLYKGMRVFYGQRRFKTFLKFILLAVFSFIMMIVLFALFMFFSAVTL